MGSIIGEKAKYWGWCREELRSVLNKSPRFSHLRSHREGTRDGKVGRGGHVPRFGPETWRDVFDSEAGTEGGGGGLLLPFSMGTVEQACLTGGLISIWGPTHPSDHDGAVGPCGGRFSSHGEKGEAELKARGRLRVPLPVR